MKKKEIQHEWEKQRGIHPETSGVHMESNTLFSYGYLSMKMLREYANGANRTASSNSADANATDAANANAAAAPAAAANVLAAADAWTDTAILDAILNRDSPFTRHDCSVEVKSVQVGMKSMEGTS